MQYFLTLLLKCSFTMSAVVLALMAFTPLLLKRYSAKWQYYIWLIVVIGFLIPFRFSINIGFLSVAAPASSTSQAPTVTAAQQLSQGISETGAVNVAGSGTDGQTSPAIPWWNVAVFLWLAGAVTTIAIQVFRHRRFLSSVQRWGAEISDQQISDILNALSVEMKISKQIRLWACPNIVSPMMIGFRNPVILLPEAEYSGNEIYYILKHELVHWKRRDLWYKSLVLLSVAVHWFNPVLYLMARAIAVQCEISCDAEVMNGTDSEQRQCYSETILHATQHRSKMHTALSTGFYGGKSGMKARISSIMDSRKKKTGVAISCIVLVTTIATGATFTAAQATAGNKVTEPFQAVAGELLNTCNFPIVLPGYLPSPPGGDEYQWSIIPDIKSDTYSIEIDQKEPEDTLGMYIGSVSGNTGEPAEQQLEQQFESGDIKATDISLSNGVTGKEYVQDTDAYGGTAIAWRTGNWSFFVCAGPEDTDNSAGAYANRIMNEIESGEQVLPGVCGKVIFSHTGNKPMTEIFWENKNGVWYSLDWQDPVDALQILKNMGTVDNSDHIWKNSFYQSVNYAPDKNLLSFTIPETIPEGYRFYLHVSGRSFMGDQSSGMSFHAFDEESQNYSWVNGKTYTYPLDAGNLDFCLLVYGLVDNNGQETLYNITVLPNGAKSIVMDQEASEPDISSSAQPSEFSVNINGKAYELGSTNTIPLEAVKTQQIKDTVSGRINSLYSYDGFSVLRDDKQSITSIEITSAGAATHRNITVGTTKNDVLKAYPEIDPAQQHIKGLWYDNGISRIDFYFNDSDILTQIEIYSNTN